MRTCNNCKYSNGWHDPDPCMACRFLAGDRCNWEPSPELHEVTCLVDSHDEVADFTGDEITRCKDCLYFKPEANTCRNPRFGNGWGNYPPPTVSETFFCFDGTRRETE